MANLDLIGVSGKFRALLDNIDLVAPVDSPVLIQGETGTGKEVVAERFTRQARVVGTASWR